MSNCDLVLPCMSIVFQKCKLGDAIRTVDGFHHPSVIVYPSTTDTSILSKLPDILWRLLSLFNILFTDFQCFLRPFLDFIKGQNTFTILFVPVKDSLATL